MLYNSLFQIVPLCLQVLVSILALYFVATKWLSPTLKSLMAAVIVLGFLVPSLLGVAAAVVFSVMASQGFNSSSGFDLFQLVFSVVSVAQGVLPLLSLAVLLIYILQRKKSTALLSYISKTSSDDSRALQSDAYSLRQAPAKAWDTEFDATRRINILRKREWAFLFDVLPVVTFNIVCLSIASKIGRSFSGSSAEQLMWVLIWLATLGLIIYIPLKDAFGGVSFGKMFSKCRVVRNRDGAPIGFGESFVRNVLFLIPVMPLVELAVASLRPDRRRLGDILAKTTVVTGEPDFVNGIENEKKEVEADEEKVAKPHPLDD